MSKKQLTAVVLTVVMIMGVAPINAEASGSFDSWSGIPGGETKFENNRLYVSNDDVLMIYRAASFLGHPLIYFPMLVASVVSKATPLGLVTVALKEILSSLIKDNISEMYNANQGGGVVFDLTDALMLINVRPQNNPARPPVGVYLQRTLPIGTVGQEYRAFLLLPGARAPLNSVIFRASGTMPPGLFILGESLRGTPAEAGTFRFTLGIEYLDLLTLIPGTRVSSEMREVVIVIHEPAAPEAFYISRDNTPVWPQPYSDGARLRELSAGTVVTVTGSLINSRDRFWFSTPDGFIYSGNLSRTHPSQGTAPAIPVQEPAPAPAPAQPIIGTATINFHPNGGIGEPASLSVLLDNQGIVSFTLPTETPVWDNNIFEGWRLGNAGEIIGPEQTISIHTGSPAEDITLVYFAQWIFAEDMREVTLTYYANGGTGAPPPQTMTFADSYTWAISYIVPTRDGYEFEGWGLASHWTSGGWQPGETISRGITDLYAIWRPISRPPNTVTVQFDAMGGTGVPVPFHAPRDYTDEHWRVWYYLPANIPVKQGYNFIGWGLYADVPAKGDSWIVQPGERSGWWRSVNFSITYFAQWEPQWGEEVYAGADMPPAPPADMPAPVPIPAPSVVSASIKANAFRVARTTDPRDDGSFEARYTILGGDGTVWSFTEVIGGPMQLYPLASQVQGMEDIVTISASGGGISGNHIAALRNDGTVWTWGNINAFVVLGDGTYETSTSAVQVRNLDNIIQVSAGSHFTVALRNDGVVWAWGENMRGVLGDGTGDSRSMPMQVRNLDNVIEISAGSSHTVALRGDGTVWAWGSNWEGQLGDGATEHRNAPVQVRNLNDIIAVSAGDQSSFALGNDGTVWAWGDNRSGQLGVGTETSSSTPVQVQNLDNIIAISTSSNHTVALRSDGTVWAWGFNHNGHLGDGTFEHRTTPVQMQNMNNVISVSAGNLHTVVVRSDYSVWLWDNNSSRRFGDFAPFTPLQVLGTGGTGFLNLGAGPPQ